MPEESYETIQKKLSEEFHLTPSTGPKPFPDVLAERINDLIQNDFSLLIHILYRIDVSELKLKETLNKYPQKDAAYLIANLIIERQLQIHVTRNRFRNNPPADNEEKW